MIEAITIYAIIGLSLIYVAGALLISGMLLSDPYVDNKTLKGKVINALLAIFWPIVTIIGLVAVILTGPPRRPPNVPTR